MGIKRFFPDIKKNFGYKKSSISLSEMANKKIAVDVSHLLYKANWARSSSNPKPILRYIAMFIYKMFSVNAFPIMIFDGRPCPLKGSTIVERKKISDGIKNDIDFMMKKKETTDDLITIDFYNSEIKKLEKRVNIRPVCSEIKELKKMLDLMYIPHYTINDHDAEAMCAFLNRKGYADYIISGDSDIFAFGGKNFIYGYKNGSSEFDCHYLDNVLKCLNFSSADQLRHYGILVGNDYNHRISGNGPVTSRKKIMSCDDGGKKLCAKLYGKESYSKIYEEYTMDYDISMMRTILTVDNKKLIDYIKSIIRWKELDIFLKNYVKTLNYLRKLGTPLHITSI